MGVVSLSEPPSDALRARSSPAALYSRAVICAGLQADLPRPEGVSPIVLVSASWPLDRARHGAGLEPALPEQPPRLFVL